MFVAYMPRIIYYNNNSFYCYTFIAGKKVMLIKYYL